MTNYEEARREQIEMWKAERGYAGVPDGEVPPEIWKVIRQDMGEEDFD